MPPKPKPPPPEENPLATEADYGAGSSPVFRVAVGGAPIDGKPTALITIVWFGGYQDPFTQRAHNGALAQIRSTYGDLVRIVWKDAPLPFHKFSMPALKIAHQARKNKGDAGFWQAHRELLAIPGGLDEKKLRAAALKLGLRPGQIQDAFSPTGELPPTFAEDRKQIEALRVQGTPHFFVNGHSLVGAQPFETFQVLIDDEIMTARDALKEGAAPDKIYETLQKGSRIGVPRPSSPPGGRPPGPGP